MPDKDDFTHEAIELQQLIDGGLYGDAIVHACKNIELLLKELYDDVVRRLPKDQADSLREQFEGLAGNDKSLSIGKWATMLRQGLETPLRNRYSPRWLNTQEIRNLAELRNKCAHERYKPTLVEAERARNALLLFLQDVNRPVIIPKPDLGGQTWASVLSRKISKDQAEEETKKPDEK